MAGRDVPILRAWNDIRPGFEMRTVTRKRRETFSALMSQISLGVILFGIFVRYNSRNCF